MPENPFLSIDDLMTQGLPLVEEVKSLLSEGDKLEARLTGFMFAGIGLAQDLRNLAAGHDFTAIDEYEPYDHRTDATDYRQ